ncbi:Ventricular zone-expressed PH domain-containing protein 1 [Cricetulus griseus]|uniref:Ventricular zone-expressed PH domain-containing protein 1 n=1 Tax=Cricetulus griseus TaxID=10029 RepID=G3H218_CRIGR|nr:Ventricular zone-expressed PH domain-containing protein 1 [Cricetulus griseus]
MESCRLMLTLGSWYWKHIEWRKTSTEVGVPEKVGGAKTKEPESEDHEKLQVKIQAFEDKINSESNTPASVRRNSLDHVSKEEQRNIRFSRSRSLALNTVLTTGMRAEDEDAEERAGVHASISLSEIDPLIHGIGKLPLKIDTHGSQLRNSSASHPSIIHREPENMPKTVKENIQEEIPETATSPVEYQDKLYLHLKENFSKVKAYAMEITKKVPVPDQCTIEGALKQAGMLIVLYFVFLKQDLDQVQLHLEEVRFFDVFGFSETAGAWQCFMCNNPEKATALGGNSSPTAKDIKKILDSVGIKGDYDQLSKVISRQ